MSNPERDGPRWRGGMPSPSIELCVEDGRIILEPKKLIPADQQWFWTEEWQAGEREAQAEIESGKVNHFNSMKDFLTDLGKDDED